MTFQKKLAALEQAAKETLRAFEQDLPSAQKCPHCGCTVWRSKTDRETLSILEGMVRRAEKLRMQEGEEP